MRTWIDPMPAMCADCPFGHSRAQTHMRKSLRPGRFNEICQSVFQGSVFSCHKTTEFDDDGEPIHTKRERECAGAIEFRRNAIANRERAQVRPDRLKRTARER